MNIAYEEAEKGWGTVNPNPMVGAVIVKNNKIIGKGHHEFAGGPHAEINALNSCSEDPENSTMYVTLEPCSTYGRTPPCTEAIKKAKINKVFISGEDPNPEHAGKAFKILSDAGIAVISGIEQERGKVLNEAFFKWIQNKTPFVILKMAMTLDGKIATQNGISKWITGPAARERVQKLRQWCDMIMVGGECARLDRPSLTVRMPENWQKQPKRVILSHNKNQQEVKKTLPKGTDIEVVSLKEQKDWQTYFKKLGKQNITAILIEGGGEIAAAALAAKVIDKIEFHIAPKILGGRDSRPVIGGLNPFDLENAQKIEKIEIKKYGDDIAISGYVKK